MTKVWCGDGRPSLGPVAYTPALVCLLARDIAETSQGHLTVDRGPEIGTRGLYLSGPGLFERESVLACLARGLALTNKPGLEVLTGSDQHCNMETNRSCLGASIP